MIDYKKLQDPNEQETELKVEEEIPRDPDEVMDEELDDKIKILDSKTKKAKKKAAKKKAKYLERVKLNMVLPTDTFDFQTEGYFSLKDIKHGEDLKKVTEGTDDPDVSEFKEDGLIEDNVESSDSDSADEDDKYDKELEKYLDKLYDQYREGRRQKVTQKLKKQKIEDTTNQEELSDEGVGDTIPHQFEDEDEDNPLIMGSEKKKTTQIFGLENPFLKEY